MENKYAQIRDFGENNLALVAKEAGGDEDENPILKYGYINRKGEEILALEYDFADSFSDNGLACVGKSAGEDEEGNTIWEYGYINEKGEEVISLQYDAAASFSENGLACVDKNVGEDEDGYPIRKSGYINEQGEEVIPLQYEYTGPFSKNGLACVGKNAGDEDGNFIIKYGFINEQGEEVISLQYDDVGYFEENGFALVGKETGITEYEEDAATEFIFDMELINEKGKKVIDSLPSGSYMRTIYGGKGLFTIESGEDENEKNKIFDKTGHATTTEEFDYVSSYYGDNDTIAVGNKTGGLDDTRDKYKCKYIDAKGKTVMEVPDKYIYAGAFVKIK